MKKPALPNLADNRSKALSSSAGVTIIELLVAIALMGIVAAFAIPGLYGVYARQQLSESANGVVTAIASARANALANDQGTYSSDALFDCGASSPYVYKYRFIVHASNTSHLVYPLFKPTSASGVTCSQPAPNSIIVPLPSSVRFDNGGNVVFDNTSGKMTASTNQLVLSHSSLMGGSIKYYVCINGNNFYVKQTACP